MKLLDASSLANTVDAINEMLFYGKSAASAAKLAAARWIAGRQGQAGSYFGLPAPMPQDLKGSARLFTGDEVTSRARTKHALGQEACRAMILLGLSSEDVQRALDRAKRQIIPRLNLSRELGMYCCGTCTCAMWRHLAAGGLDMQQRRLAEGLKTLKGYRRSTGWYRFPFYYTLLALSEIDLPAARTELRHVAAACERRLVYFSYTELDPYDRRRRDLLQRVLAKC